MYQQFKISSKNLCRTFHQRYRVMYPSAHNHCFYAEHSSSSSKLFSSSIKKDPTAKRPNKICDPYGLNGQCMTYEVAKSQTLNLDEGWTLLPRNPSSTIDAGTGVTVTKDETIDENIQNLTLPPVALEKEFSHMDYLSGSRFVSILAAVAHNNNHYPSIKLERRLLKKEKAWEIVSTVTCYTEVLDGLSFHDFHIAMLIDVEVARVNVQSLINSEKIK
mmetsp:Transcript_15215/g.18517  ORF Transcript_15215/g.18517 Transcript_15215/m.18517 type:complete len:218 (-) Transcript_15215:903-1556(-)